MSRPTPNEVVGGFVLEYADRLDATSRAQLFRAMAELTGDESEAEHFRFLAVHLEEMERRQRHLKLTFGRRNA